MNCKKAREVVSDYLDGCLPLQVRIDYEAHMEECRDCAAELGQTRDMLAALGSLRANASPVDCWPSLRARIQEQGRPAPRWQFLLKPVIAAPAAALAAVLTMLLVLPGQEPPGRSPATMSEFGHYVTAHARLQRQQAFADPDVTFVAAELERASLKADSDQP